jgi:hypothetical protein
MEEPFDKWERLERERLVIQPETLHQLELLMNALDIRTVDETVRRLLSSRHFSLQVGGMVETLQQAWKVQEPLEVVARLVRDALDRLAHEESLLVLLEELEGSFVSDPVAYLRGLVQQDRQGPAGETQALVDYQRLPYSHLVGIQTPAAMRERWRRAIWTIMRFNQTCERSSDRWYINGWSVSEVAGGWLRDLDLYLDEIRPLLLKHHQDLEVHPNLNCKAVTIGDQVRIAEEPPPPSTLWLGSQVLLPDDFPGEL